MGMQYLGETVKVWRKWQVYVDGARSAVYEETPVPATEMEAWRYFTQTKGVDSGRVRVSAVEPSRTKCINPTSRNARWKKLNPVNAAIRAKNRIGKL